MKYEELSLSLAEIVPIDLTAHELSLIHILGGVALCSICCGTGRLIIKGE